MLTGIYVFRANGEFDELNQKIPGSAIMKGKFLLPLAGSISTPLLAADAISGEVQRQPSISRPS